MVVEIQLFRSADFDLVFVWSYI